MSFPATNAAGYIRGHAEGYHAGHAAGIEYAIDSIIHNADNPGAVREACRILRKVASLQRDVAEKVTHPVAPSQQEV